MSEFYLTGMGRKFYERDIPRIASALSDISKILEEKEKRLCEDRGKIWDTKTKQCELP